MSEYIDIKTDRKSLNIEGEWGQGGERLLSSSVSEYRYKRDRTEWESGIVSLASEYRDIKTDRKGEWGKGGDRLLSTSVSEYRDIREKEQDGRVGLSPSHLNTEI